MAGVLGLQLGCVMSWLVRLWFCLWIAAIPKHDLLLYGIQYGLTSVRIVLGPLEEPGHGFHVQVCGLQLRQGQFQGGAGFVVAQIGSDSVAPLPILRLGELRFGFAFGCPGHG